MKISNIILIMFILLVSTISVNAYILRDPTLPIWYDETDPIYETASGNTPYMSEVINNYKIGINPGFSEDLAERVNPEITDMKQAKIASINRREFLKSNPDSLRLALYNYNSLLYNFMPDAYADDAIIYNSHGDPFIAWDWDTNANYPLAGLQGNTANYIVNTSVPSYITNWGYSQTHLATYGTPNNNVITVVDGNGLVGVITMGTNGFTILNLTGGLLYETHYSIGETGASNAQIINPYSDAYDKLIFATNKYIYVYNLSISSNFAQIRKHDITNVYSRSPDGNINFGCMNAYSTDAKCLFTLYDSTSGNAYSYIYLPNPVDSINSDTEAVSDLQCDDTSTNTINPISYPSYYKYYLSSNHYMVYPVCKKSNKISITEYTSTTTNNGTAYVNIQPDTDYNPIISAQSYFASFGNPTATQVYVGAINTYNSSGATGNKVTEYRYIYDWNLSTQYLKLVSTATVKYSNFFIGDYQNDGYKEACIFIKNITAVTNYLYCWNNAAGTLSLTNYTFRSVYPYDFDIERNGIIEGYFVKAGNTCNNSFSSDQGVIYSCNGGNDWTLKNDNDSLYIPYDDSGAAGMYLDNGMPYAVFDDYCHYLNYGVSTPCTTSHRFTTIMSDPLNGYHGTINDTISYYNTGLVWWNDFIHGYQDGSQTLKNIVNASQNGSAIGSPTYTALGLNFNGVDSYINTPTFPISNLTNFSMIFVFNASNNSSLQYIVDVADSSSTRAISIVIAAAGNLEITNVYTYNTIIQAINKSQLYSILFTRNNDGNTMIYVDGVLKYNNTPYSNISTPSIRLGNTHYGTPQYFNGTIQYFKLYNITLTGSSAPSISNNGYCYTNSDCTNPLYTKCAVGCCVDSINTSFPLGANQCSEDSDNQICMYPLNSSFNINLLVGNYGDALNNAVQNTTCYYQGVYRDQSNQTGTPTSCPSVLIDSAPIGSTCSVFSPGLCASPGNVGGQTCSGTVSFNCNQFYQNPTACLLHSDACNWAAPYCEKKDCGDYYLSQTQCQNEGCTFTVYSSSTNGTGYYSCLAGYGYDLIKPYGYYNQTQELILCDLGQDQYGTSAFVACAEGTNCINGACLGTNCTPGMQVCSNGQDFSKPYNDGSVYTCNSDGSKWQLTQLCNNQAQTCSELNTFYATCNNNLIYYCYSSNSPSLGCSYTYFSNTNTIPSNCYVNQSDCQSAAYAYYQTQQNPQGSVMGSDQGELRNVWNLVLGANGFGKMVFAMFLIILAIAMTYAIIAKMSPPGTPIEMTLPLLAGLIAFIIDVLSGLISVWVLVIIIVGFIGVMFLSRYMMKPISAQ